MKTIPDGGLATRPAEGTASDEAELLETRAAMVHDWFAGVLGAERVVDATWPRRRTSSRSMPFATSSRRTSLRRSCANRALRFAGVREPDRNGRALAFRNLRAGKVGDVNHLGHDPS